LYQNANNQNYLFHVVQHVSVQSIFDVKIKIIRLNNHKILLKTLKQKMMTTQLLKKVSPFIIAVMMFSVIANAQVIYTDLNPDSTSSGNYNLDLNADGITDYLIAHIIDPSCSGHVINYIKITPANGSMNNISKLTAGAKITTTSVTYSSTVNQVMAESGYKIGKNGSCSSYTNSSCKWNSATDGYMALKLVVGTNSYFGWARLGTTGTSSFTIKEFAYNSIPNRPILAGEISCTAPSVTLTVTGSLSFCNGDSVTFTANGTGYAYQWKKDNVNITGASKQSYVAKTAGIYKCTVTNSCGTKTSGTRTVTVPCKLTNEVFTEQLDKPYELKVAPNPLSYSTTVSFSLDNAEKVSLKIFDINGRLIKVLADQIYAEGQHAIEWNPENINAGVYYLQMQTAGFSQTEKLVVTR
jgi:hypothetical protein